MGHETYFANVFQVGTVTPDLSMAGPRDNPTTGLDDCHK